VDASLPRFLGRFEPVELTRWRLAIRARDLGFIVLMTGFVCRSGAAPSAVTPKPVTMQDLTVPKDRLPDGCSLKIDEPPTRRLRQTSNRSPVPIDR
jgi:hypothetical protein